MSPSTVEEDSTVLEKDPLGYTGIFGETWGLTFWDGPG